MRARPALSAAFSTLKATGPLSDQDRIFTNLYGKHDYKLKGAMARVRTLLRFMCSCSFALFS